MKLLLTIFTAGLFFSSSLTAQEYYTNFQEYKSRDGFEAFEGSGRAVKDSKGFLWIGTDNGLYRFDGQNFKSFHRDPADTSSLSSDDPSNVFIEKNGTFWVSDQLKGVVNFDPVTQKFHRWRNSNSNVIDINEQQVSMIFQDRREDVWFVFFGRGLARLNKKDNTLELFSFYEGPANNPRWESTAFINDVREDSKHIFWVATQAGLIRFNPETGSYSKFRDTTHGKINEGRHTQINSVYVDSSGMIWVGTWGGGVKKFDQLTKKWETYYWELEYLENSTRNIAHDILRKSATELWIATFSQLMIFNTITGAFTKVLAVNSPVAATISGHRLFDDGSGFIWCSGLRSLSKIELKNEIFNFTRIPDNPRYGSGLVVANTFLNDPANQLLFIGTYHSKGFYTQNTQTGVITNYPLVSKKVFNENINQVLMDKDKTVWVCYNSGVRIFNIRTKQFSFISPSVKNASFLNSRVYAALEDDDGSIWFASSEKGLLHYDKKLQEINVFVPDNGQLPADFILSLFKDSRKNIWLGFHGKSGLACIAKDRRHIKFYNHANYKVPQADVISITESKEGDIFFTLYVYGLGKITDPLSGKDSFRLYTKDSGLPGNKVVGLVKDKLDNLWISTNNGLTMCNTRSMSFQQFNLMYGLRENNSESILYCDEKGLVYLGNVSGFQVFNPDFVNRKNEIPRVILHSFRIRGKEYPGNINAVNSISLNYSEANFSFEYAALSFSGNERIQYAYRLKGLEKEWRIAGKQRIAAYSLAHGGTYLLQIKASNPQGQWNDQFFELVIKVKPPFWETWWFIGLCVVLVGMLLFWVTRMRIKMIRRTEERKTHINKIKAEA